MAIPTKTIRGLQDIRTHSGRVSEAGIPYKAYMRLSCLEMEKYRRTQEQESAMTRLNNIEARFREIENEKAVILAAMRGRNAAGPVEEHKGGTEESQSGSTSRQGSGGFKVKY